MLNFKLFVKADDEAAAPAPEAPADLPPLDPTAEAGMPPDMAAGMPPMPPEAAVPEVPEENPIDAIKARLQGALGTDSDDEELDKRSKGVTERGGFSG